MRESVPSVSWIGFLVVIAVVLGGSIAVSLGVSCREANRAVSGADGPRGDEPPPARAAG